MDIEKTMPLKPEPPDEKPAAPDPKTAPSSDLEKTMPLKPAGHGAADQHRKPMTASNRSNTAEKSVPAAPQNGAALRESSPR